MKTDYFTNLYLLSDDVSSVPKDYLFVSRSFSETQKVFPDILKEA